MIDTVVFDVDGVLTASATVHLEAWTALFDEILPPEVDPFTRADYERLVDGRSRRDGLVAVLDDRRLLSPPRRGGGLDVEALAERKQRHFLAALDRHGSDLAFPDTIPCLGELRSLGYGLVAASSSRNARALLQAAGLIEQLDHIVDGEDLVRLGLNGKPAPDLFVRAAARAGSTPPRCAVVEDSIAGLHAGLNGDFGLVIGVDRSPRRVRGLDAIARVTVASLAELRVVLSTEPPPVAPNNTSTGPVTDTYPFRL